MKEFAVQLPLSIQFFINWLHTQLLQSIRIHEQASIESLKEGWYGQCGIHIQMEVNSDGK